MAQDFNQNILIVFCQKHGIKKEFTTSYTCQQNGVSEEKKKLLLGLSKVFFSFTITNDILKRGFNHYKLLIKHNIFKNINTKS
jgi:hypothetical protein